MAYRRVGLGDPMGSADCQWCQQNAGIAMFFPSCWATKSMFGGSCQEPSIAQAYVQGSTPVVPPDQATIDAQTPDETINQILLQSQVNAVAAAQAQAVREAAALPATTFFGLSIMDWLIGGAIVAGLFIVGGRR